jgi:2-C-methyl-D-erythritol 4-phosphate cytidylyltransferase
LDNQNSVGVVVVSAGKGSRMGTRESKQYLLMDDKPIVIHTLEVAGSGNRPGDRSGRHRTMRRVD